MNLTILFLTRFIVYGLGGYIAYKKRMWWLMAICIDFMLVAFLVTFHREEARSIIAILSNFGAVFLVMTALRNPAHYKDKPTIKIDTIVTNQQVDTQIVDKQTVNKKESKV